MIYRSYFKSSKDVHFEAAHLYEHAFIELFYEGHVAMGYGAFLSGETFYRSGIFLTAHLSSDENAALLDTFIYNNSSVESTTGIALSQLGAEAAGSYRIKNRSDLQAQLSMLYNRPWELVATLPLAKSRPHGSPVRSPLGFRKQEDDFRDANVSFSFTYSSDEDAGLFGYLTGLMIEAVSKALQTKLGVRCYPSGMVEDRQKQLYIKLMIRTHKKISNSTLRTHILEALRTLSRIDSFSTIEDYLSAWRKAPHMDTLTTELYRSSGFIVSRETAYRLLSHERVNRIIDSTRLTINFRRV